MKVCSKCGYPLGEEASKDPPVKCPTMSCSGRTWIEQEQFQAERDARRRRTQPKPKPLPEGIGGIAFIGDEIHGAAMDWATGRQYKSKQKRAKDYKAKGLHIYGADEMRRKLPDFQGQRTVRTNLGTRVI